MTKTDYDPDRSLVLIEGLSHFLTNFLQNLASCQTSLNKNHSKIRVVIYATREYSNTFFTSTASAQICRVKKDTLRVAYKNFLAPVSLDNNFFYTLKI
jgi:hypothetical protein